MELVRPNINYKDKYLEYINEVMINNEMKMLEDSGLKENESFDEMLIRTEKIWHKENLIGMMKPTSVFWMIEDDKIVGSMNLCE